ncbi:efflux transporter outer membrane subunit [Desulfoluna spongiiphila]|uniref:efflux transporter outer membrane subunit n=1 Tax=Desulfoluna spongiiphila TaxID=419481 RepID=UPI0012557C1D|nr:efflux transporter outer membrane subunit [Desulfoluna spongiiphila]VVS93910.1 rnd efflux system outer membrane lipoprotein nodt [Desulfoluna spongiiphila]
MKRCWLIVLALGLAAFSACSVHERTATGALVEKASDLRDTRDETLRPEVDWWLSFEDETLNGLVARALGENPTLEEAAANVRKAEAFLAGQKAADLPGINLSGSAGRARTEGFMGGISNSWSLSAVASYELDLWGGRQALEAQRALDREASLASLSATLVSVSAQVADTWYLRLERQVQLDLSEERVDMRRELLEMIEWRYGQGTATARDVYDTRTELAVDEVTLARYRTDVAVADHALSALLNRKPGDFEDTVPGISGKPLPTMPPLADEPLSSRLILGRPDMVRAMLDVKKADEAVAVSLADRFPSFSLTAGYGRAGDGWEAGSTSGPVWNIGGDLLAPLIDWGRRKALVEADRAAFDESLARYRSTALVAFTEAADALTRCRNGEREDARLQESLDASSATTAYVTSRYLEGASDYLTLMIARIAENEARSRLATSRRLLLSNRIGLARALGGSFSDTWVRTYVTTD